MVCNLLVYLLKSALTIGLNILVFIGLAYQGKDTVFRFIIEYSNPMDFGP
jgi:hypothetical protein